MSRTYLVYLLNVILSITDPDPDLKCLLQNRVRYLPIQVKNVTTLLLKKAFTRR